MAEEKKPRKPSNEISEETGAFDMRFILWRDFCARHNVPVETLPSELTGETKEKWERLKDERLHKPYEGK